MILIVGAPLIAVGLCLMVDAGLSRINGGPVYVEGNDDWRWPFGVGVILAALGMGLVYVGW